MQCQGWRGFGLGGGYIPGGGGCWELGEAGGGWKGFWLDILGCNGGKLFVGWCGYVQGIVCVCGVCVYVCMWVVYARGGVGWLISGNCVLYLW